MNRKADERLQTQLQQKLLSHGLRPPCKVTVTVRDGLVTLAGTVQHDYQKKAALHACRATSGVKRVVDNIQAPRMHNVWASSKEWEVAKPKAKPVEPAAEQPVQPVAEEPVQATAEEKASQSAAEPESPGE